MPKAVAERFTVSVVGPGNLGSALALNLSRAGYEIRHLVVGSRDKVPSRTVKSARRLKAKVIRLGKVSLDTDLVWITVPDDAISVVAAQLAATQDWKGVTVFHSSGALTSEVLAPLRAKGARVASVHPGMTFVRQSMPRLKDVPFGVEGEAAAVRLAKKIIRDLGGISFPIKAESKVLYHAFDAFASPMVIALMTALEQVGKAAGIKSSDLRVMAAPLLKQTLNNYLEHGAAAAFSGPLIRGDVATVRRHLTALKQAPQAREVYVSLSRAAIEFLPVKNRAAIARELKEINQQRGPERLSAWGLTNS